MLLKEIANNGKNIRYRRISIFAGHYGSGKTEIAVNFAIMLSNKGYKTAIIDLDIVNPFFRTADAVKVLQDNNVKVIYPVYANTNVDVPALPRDVYGIFQDKDTYVILDVGGDDLGAKVLGYYKRELLPDDTEFFFVINTKRPFTNSLESIDKMFCDISISSGLCPTQLINNTNMLKETDYNIISEGYDIVRDYSKIQAIPVGFTAMLREVYEKLSPEQIQKFDCPVLLLDKAVMLPWD